MQGVSEKGHVSPLRLAMPGCLLLPAHVRTQIEILSACSHIATVVTHSPAKSQAGDYFENDIH